MAEDTFDPTSLGLVPADDHFDPAQLGLVPLDSGDHFDPSSLGLVPMDGSAVAAFKAAQPAFAASTSYLNATGIASALQAQKVQQAAESAQIVQDVTTGPGGYLGAVARTPALPIAPEQPTVHSVADIVRKRLDLNSENMQTPIVGLPKPENRGVVSGTIRGVETLGEGLETPENISLLASIEGAPIAIKTIASAAFRALMVKTGAEAVASTINEPGTPGERAEKLTIALGSFGLASMPEGRLREPTELPAASKDASAAIVSQAPTDALQAASEDPKLTAHLHPEIRAKINEELASRLSSEIEPALPRLPGDTQDKVREIIAKQASGEPLSQNEQATMIQVRSLASKVKGDQTNAEFTAPTSQPPGTTPPPTPEAAGETTGSPPAQGGRSSLFSQALAEQAPAAELDALHLERQRLADPFNHEPGWQEKLDHIDAILDSHDQTAVAESAHRTSQNLTPETAKALDETPNNEDAFKRPDDFADEYKPGRGKDYESAISEIRSFLGFTKGEAALALSEEDPARAVDTVLRHNRGGYQPAESPAHVAAYNEGITQADKFVREVQKKYGLAPHATDADSLESTGSMDTINGMARKYGVPEDVIDKGWNSMGQDWLREQIRQKMNPPTYDATRVDDYATRVPGWIGDAAKSVLVEGKSVEEAAGEAGQTVKNTQAAVDKAKAYLDTAKTVARTPSESPFGRDEVSTEARPDSPEIEQVKDWTSATGDVSEPARMKRGGGESGGLQLPKFADRTMSELDQATTERSAKLQKSFDESERARKEIEKAIPSGRRRNAASVWMEADGDAAKLAAWEAGAKGKLFRDAARDAQTLTPEEIAIARKAKAAFDVLATRGQAHGVIKSQRDNYVPHLWDLDKKTSIGGGGKLQQSMKFAKARTFDNFAAGDAAGFTPKSLDIAKLLPTYITEMNKVVADRQFVADLASRTAEDGRPLVVPRGAVKGTVSPTGDYATMINPDAIKSLKDASGNKVDTTDYEVMPDQPALHDWNWEKSDLNGNPMFMRDDLAVHPDAAKRINAMLGRSGLKDIPGVAAVDKAQGIMKREMFGLLAPFHQVQEGTHAIAHRVNPFFGLETVDMRNPAMYDAARHGLMLLPDRSTAAGYMEGVGGKGTFLTQALRFLGEKTDASGKGELVGKAATALANVVDGYQNLLFHQYIPALKFKTYEAMLDRNMSVYAHELKSGTMTKADVKLTSAEQANAAYGHLNRDLLDRDPTAQHLMQLTMLAPDFLEARGRFVGQATKGLLGSKVGVEQFKALAFMTLVQGGAAYVISKLTGNPYDPKKPFSVTAGGREYTMRSVPEDLLRLGTDVKNATTGGDRGLPFINARVNPLLASAGELLTGRNWRGEKTTTRDTVEEMMAKYIPITARSIPGIRNLTETSRQSPISPMEQLAGSLGLKISRASPITDTYAKASDWMESQKIPKDKGSYQVSKFQQLRYALEDGDMDKAKDELAKLKAGGGTPAKLAQGFRESVNHPFTKSANMDLQFRNSLNPSDRAVFDLAKTKREQILQRFGSIR